MRGMGRERRRELLSLLLCFVLAMTCLAAPASAVPPGTDILNTAEATFTQGGTPTTVPSNTVITTTVVQRTPSDVEFYQYVPGPGTPTNIEPGQQCSTSGASSGPFVPMPPVTDSGGTPINLSSPVDLYPNDLFRTGEPVFLQLTDLDQNLDPATAESITLRVTVPATGDAETLILIETGLDTGIFLGPIMLASPPPVSGDCQLTADVDMEIRATYVDPSDPGDTSMSTALVDPFGVVFDSSTGDAIDGAEVTLINTSTGLPATVYGDDGVSLYPATVTSGGSATDSSGGIYNFPPGQYRFPHVLPGDYRIEVVPPIGYRTPSTVPTAQLQSLPGAPYAIVPGSRGENFNLPTGPAMRLDLPLDPNLEGLFVQKNANKTDVEVGEFVQYRIDVSNDPGSAYAANVVLTDTLPVGFRYEPGSAKLDDGTPITPEVSDNALQLTFQLGDLAAGESVRIQYVTAVIPIAKPGYAINTAVAIADGDVVSNLAEAKVYVNEDGLTEHVIIMGRVMVDSCEDAIDDPHQGIPGVQVYMEDGRYALTDENGLFHFEGILPGVHVVQMDPMHLPEGYEAITCGDPSVFANQPLSQFVDAQRGGIWRTDFRVQRKQSELTQRLSTRRTSEGIEQRVELTVGSYPVTKPNVIVSLAEGTHLDGGSVRFDDQPIDAQDNEGTLVIRLPALEADTSHVLRFTTRDVSDPNEGPEVITRAVLVAKGPGGETLRLPPVETVLAASEAEHEFSSEIQSIAVLAKPFEAPVLEDETKEKAEAALVRFEDQFDQGWLAQQEMRRDWVYPAGDFIPKIPSLKIGVMHPPGERVRVLVNGVPVSPLSLEGTLTDETKRLALTRWRGVQIFDGPNSLVAIFEDEDGNETGRIQRTTVFTGTPASAELVEEQSLLVADGRTVPVLAIRLRDKSGELVREGVSGFFYVAPPHQSLEIVDRLRNPVLEKLEEDPASYVVGKDGIALLQLHPTNIVGKAKVGFRFANDIDEEIETWLSPGDRDWILVALANATISGENVSGDEAHIKAADLDDDTYQEGRVAFFAKGRVKGDFLLTLAYDSEKEDSEIGRRLTQVIDPDEYFTLYGDNATQGFDAASTDKLYVKLEREKFYALYGDHVTGLSETELGRYQRALTGLKTEYYGDKLRVNAFASDTDQVFIKDEIRGDGTSGLYHLSRNPIILNSDEIVIQVRDRFRSEVILKEEPLSSHIDYNIDYRDGTIFFRRPIPSRDEDFNPVYIVARYEIEADDFEDITAGGRVAVRMLDGDLEVGTTFIHEEEGEADGDLVAIDAELYLDEVTTLTVELAGSQREIYGDKDEDHAVIVELERISEYTLGEVYFREEGKDFGLGQQNGSESGTRKYGADVRHALTEEITLDLELLHSTNLESDAKRKIAEMGAEYRKGQLEANLGGRYVESDDTSNPQLLAGARYGFFDGRLSLFTNGEVSLADEDPYGDYVDRLTSGIDYKIHQNVSVFAHQELTFGDKDTASNTRAGVEAQPWTGGNLHTSVTDESRENGGRTFANLGLTQTFRLNDNWSFDGSIDRAQNLSNNDYPAFNSDVPLVSGTRSEDFTAISLGSNYHKGTTGFAGRVEHRRADSEDRWGLFLSTLRDHDENTSHAARLELFTSDFENGQEDSEARLRLSLAHRPLDTKWIVLNRMDFDYHDISGVEVDTETRKLINHLKVNYQPDRDIQYSGHLGMKYVVDTLDGDRYDSVTGLLGFETRYHFTPKWDISGHIQGHHTFDTEYYETSYGFSVGRSLLGSMWVSLGYNFDGFRDDDFAGSEYTSKGAYLKIRAKLDQNTVRRALETFGQ